MSKEEVIGSAEARAGGVAGEREWRERGVKVVSLLNRFCLLFPLRASVDRSTH